MFDLIGPMLNLGVKYLQEIIIAEDNMPHHITICVS